MFLVFILDFLKALCRRNKLNYAVARCALPIYFKDDGLLPQKALEVRILHWYGNEFQNYLEVA